MAAHERLLHQQTKAQAWELGIRTALRLLALEPLQEAVHRTLMRLYRTLGRRGMALQQYEVCVGLLHRELDVEPKPETRRLYEEMVQQGRSGASAGPSGGSIDPGEPARDRSPLQLPVHDAPMIGREVEVAELRRRLEEAWRGHGSSVVILGEAGIGKTRLLEEIGAEAFRRDGRVLLGRCYGSERILPFQVWVDAVQRSLGVSDIEALRDLGPVWRSELARLLPELGAPSPRTSAGDQDYLRLFEAVVQLIRRLAASTPLVVCLDDLHWADDLSLRLVAFLGHRVQAWPVLILCTAREEDLDDQRLLRSILEELGHTAGIARLTLAALTRSNTAALVRYLARAGGEDSALARAEADVWEISGGNPFVVVERMRALHDERLPTTISEPCASLPERVRALIAGRLRGLSPASQDSVASAAVIGREFDFALLQRSARLDEWAAAQAVEELVRRRVLKVIGERFDFTHDRVRNVAYSELLPPRRRLLHAHIAKALV